MVSLTLSLNERLFSLLQRFSWVNWSEVVREKLNKKRIFEEFLKTGTLSDEDQKFCDRIDWYPVDELPLREGYVKKLKEIAKKPAGKPMTAEEFEKWCDSL